MRRTLAGLLAAVAALGLAACGSSKPGTFHPAGSLSPAAAPVGQSSTSSDGLSWPPFGADVHIVMPSWLPGNSDDQAVVTAKNFLLAFLYAEYTGNKDQRWTSYVSGADVTLGLKGTLNTPDVTSQSFKGTIRFTQMKAFPDPTTHGAIDVSECFDDSQSQNTSLATGKVVPDHTPADQHYYLNTDVLAQTDGWHVTQVYPVVYYPRAKECRP